MKRKGVDEAKDDFFDFALSSPALKIRRLGSEFSPMVNEEETTKPVASMPFQDTMGSSPIASDKLSNVPVNEERAIVLYNTPSFRSPPPLSISAHSDFISGFKNPVIWSNRATAPKSYLHETRKQDDGSSAVHEVIDAMDVEDDFNTNQIPKHGLSRWQQHCMIQQPPSILSPRITWFGRAV